MSTFLPYLFIEINHKEFIFIAGQDEDNNFKIIEKSIVSIENNNKNKNLDFELFSKIIKENIFLLEKKLNYSFKDVYLILDSFEATFLNLTGFKKLNGSQVLRENIIYILNSLKSNIYEVENKKSILHIFNTSFILDQKILINPPIGLFGDFYAHELSFCLIDNNDYKNLNNIFNSQNLKIERIFLKSYAEGTYISSSNSNAETFFHIRIESDESKVFYFENDALKFEQKFNFGSDMIIKDISKITFLNFEAVRKIVSNIDFKKEIFGDELVDSNLLIDEKNKKIKKKLVYEIASARIKELAELILTKNINLKNKLKNTSTLFFELTDKSHYDSMKDIYGVFFKTNDLKLNFLDNLSTEGVLSNLNKIVQFGWKKEAIPITKAKKSIITRFFEAIFN